MKRDDLTTLSGVLPDARDAEAVILRVVPLGESDLLVDYLDSEGRRASAVARGARRSRRRFAGCLQPFARVRLKLGRRRRGSQGLGRLEEATLLRGHVAIGKNLRAYSQGCYLLELVAAFVPEGDPHPSFWSLLRDVLEILDNRPLNDVEMAYLRLRVLDAAGLAPHLDGCSACGAEDSARWWPEQGATGFVCERCGGSGRMWMGRRGLDMLRRLAARKMPRGTDPKETERLNEILSWMLGQHAGRQFKSEAFLRSTRE
ncbi:MAG: DNA repair protein RecO [Deltaproteobacteria bacterium]|nr:MAG: DNA repair protein RecO [Deltaproteobacteria bacterium]